MERSVHQVVLEVIVQQGSVEAFLFVAGQVQHDFVVEDDELFGEDFRVFVLNGRIVELFHHLRHEYPGPTLLDAFGVPLLRRGSVARVEKLGPFEEHLHQIVLDCLAQVVFGFGEFDFLLFEILQESISGNQRSQLLDVAKHLEYVVLVVFWVIQRIFLRPLIHVSRISLVHL